MRRNEEEDVELYYTVYWAFFSFFLFPYLFWETKSFVTPSLDFLLTGLVSSRTEIMLCFNIT